MEYFDFNKDFWMCLLISLFILAMTYIAVCVFH
jgi:hypothetical protein